jgi:hypothetical protein
MTNAPETRKTHVIRILGTNKNGDVIPDIWADVERIDQAKSVYQHDETLFQGSVRNLKWLDNPDQDGYNPDGPPSRKSRIVKVCSPDEANVDDPEEWIPIQIIDKMRSSISDQNEVSSFVNAERSNARIVKVRRILHYDTNIDDEAQAAFDADPTRMVYVVPGYRYERKDGTKDDSQWVEHEVIEYLKGSVSNQTTTGQGGDQNKQVKLLNQYLIDESEPAKLEVLGNNNVNPPYRLDPYQNIVNVQFAGATEFDFSGGSVTPVMQKEASLSASKKCTISFWVAIDTDQDLGTLSSSVSLISLSLVTDSPFAADAGGIDIALERSFDTTFLLIGVNGEPQSLALEGSTTIFDPDHEPSWYGEGQIFTPSTTVLAVLPSNDNIGIRRWAHFFIVIDMTTASAASWNGSTNIFATGPRFSIYVNGQHCALERGSLRPDNAPDDRQWALALGKDGGTPFSQDPVAQPGTAPSYSVFIPGFNIGWSDATIGVPLQTVYADYGGPQNYGVAYANVQVWTNTVIEPSNLDKFMSPNPDDPTRPFMVPGSVAANTFGQPQIWFDGSPTSFKKSRGSLEFEMDVVGKPNSYSPRPTVKSS